MKSIIKTLSCIARWAFAAVVLTFAAITSFWLWYPYEPLVINGPIEIVNPGKIVNAGENVEYKISYDKKMFLPGTLTRKLINTYKIEYPDVTTTAPIGPDTDIIALPVPVFAHSGEHYIWWSITYRVNPIRYITVQRESETSRVRLKAR